MKCPFLINTIFDYECVVSNQIKEEEPKYLETSQRQEFADCIGTDCPYYESWDRKCRQVEAIVDCD